jgi:hypothetical protein
MMVERRRPVVAEGFYEVIQREVKEGACGS